MVTVGVSGVVQAVIEALQGRLVGAPSGTRQRVRCPFVEHHKHGDEHPSAWLNLKTGWVNCAVCGSYSPQQVLQRLGENVPSSPAPVQQTAPVTSTDIDLQAVWQSLPANPPPYALGRGLHPTTCIAYGLRGGDSWHVPAGALAIPHLDERLRVVAIKYRLPAGEQRYGAVKGSRPLLFGAHLCIGGGVLVVVEGEINAASVWQVAGQAVEVVSFGAQRPSNEALEYFVRFVRRQQYERVILWFDDAAQVECLSVRLLGICKRIDTWETIETDKGKLDANELLQRGMLADQLQAVVGVSSAAWRRFVETQQRVLEELRNTTTEEFVAQWRGDL